MATQMQLKGFFWWEIAWPPVSCEAETTKESIKTKQKAEIVSVSMLYKILSLDYCHVQQPSHKKGKRSRMQTIPFFSCSSTFFHPTY